MTSADGDWIVSSGSLTLPPFVGPSDDAIILDPAPPGCLGTRYAATIVWRQNSPLFRGQFFIGIVKNNLVPSGTQTWVERGFMLDDPGSGICWIYVTGRWRSNFDPINGNTVDEDMGALLTIGGPPPLLFTLNVSGELLLNFNGLEAEWDTRKYDSEIDLPTTGSAVYVSIGNTCGTTFTAPDTGCVRIIYTSELHVSAAGNFGLGTIEVREGAVFGAGTVILSASDNNQLIRNDNVNDVSSCAVMVICGLVGRQTYNTRMMFRTNAVTLSVGRRSISVEAWQ